ARKDAAHERTVDRAAVHGSEFGQALLPFRKCRAALAGPDEGVESESGDTFRVTLVEKSRLQSAGGDAVNEEFACAGFLRDELRAGRKIVGTVGYVAIDRPRLVRASVAFVVHAPGVESARSKPVHHVGVRPAGH